MAVACCYGNGSLPLSPLSLSLSLSAPSLSLSLSTAPSLSLSLSLLFLSPLGRPRREASRKAMNVTEAACPLTDLLADHTGCAATRDAARCHVTVHRRPGDPLNVLTASAQHCIHYTLYWSSQSNGHARGCGNGHARGSYVKHTPNTAQGRNLPARAEPCAWAPEFGGRK